MNRRSRGSQPGLHPLAELAAVARPGPRRAATWGASAAHTRSGWMGSRDERRHSAHSGGLACRALSTCSRHAEREPGRGRSASASRAAAPAGSAASASAMRASERRRLDVDRDDPTVAREGLAEAEREVERLAEQQHEVGLGEHPGRAAQPRIVQAARTLDRQRRRAGRIRQPLHGGAPWSAPQRRPRENQRPLGLGQPRQHRRHVVVRRAATRRRRPATCRRGLARRPERTPPRAPPLPARRRGDSGGPAPVVPMRPARARASMSSPTRAASSTDHAAFVTGRGGGDLIDFLEGAAPALRRRAGAATAAPPATPPCARRRAPTAR